MKTTMKSIEVTFSRQTETNRTPVAMLSRESPRESRRVPSSTRVRRCLELLPQSGKSAAVAIMRTGRGGLLALGMALFIIQGCTGCLVRPPVPPPLPPPPPIPGPPG